MILNDDRTEEQKKTHPIIIIGTDSFMSGWGKAEGMTSYAGWACKHEHADRVFNWVNSRDEMKRVRLVIGDYKPKGNVHCHIYVVTDEHPATKY